MRSEPADGGGSSSTQLTQIEQEYIDNAVSNVSSAIGSWFGGGTGGGGHVDIKFDPDTVNQLIKYFEKVRYEELEQAKFKARALVEFRGGGHQEADAYAEAVNNLGDNYMNYHSKLSDAIDKTIDALRKASGKYVGDDHANADAFRKASS